MFALDRIRNFTQSRCPSFIDSLKVLSLDLLLAREKCLQFDIFSMLSKYNLKKFNGKVLFKM